MSYIHKALGSSRARKGRLHRKLGSPRGQSPSGIVPTPSEMAHSSRQAAHSSRQAPLQLPNVGGLQHTELAITRRETLNCPGELKLREPMRTQPAGSASHTLRSFFVQARPGNAWRSPAFNSDKRAQPVWDERHHVTDPSQNPEMRLRLPAVVTMARSKCSPPPSTPDAGVSPTSNHFKNATNYATFHASTSRVRPSQWCSKQPEQQHEVQEQLPPLSSRVPHSKPSEKDGKLLDIADAAILKEPPGLSFHPYIPSHILEHAASKSKQKLDALVQTTVEPCQTPLQTTNENVKPLASHQKTSKKKLLRQHSAKISAAQPQLSKASTGLRGTEPTESSMQQPPVIATDQSLDRSSKGSKLSSSSTGEALADDVSTAPSKEEWSSNETSPSTTIVPSDTPTSAETAQSPKMPSDNAPKESTSTEEPLPEEHGSSQIKSTNKQKFFYARRGSNAKSEAKPSDSVNVSMPSVCLVPFTAEEKSVLRGFFDLHDSDGSESLSLEELVAVVDDIGRAPKQGSSDASRFEQLMHKADEDNSSELNFEEFTSFLAEYYQSVYWRLFVQNDTDRSGTITRFELKGLMVRLKEEGFKVKSDDIVALFASIDDGGDGILDWREFCDFMCGYRKLEYELLREGAGFRESEIEHLEAIFEKADEDGSGQLGIQEVIDLLERSLTGSKVETQEQINKICTLFARMDKDKSMTLDFSEFLRLLRVWSNNSGKQEGKQEILKVFKDAYAGGGERRKSDPNKKQSVRLRAQKTIVDSGICVENKAEAEKIAEDLRQIAVQHDVEDGILVQLYGLSIEEVRCLRESFEFCDADGSGHIDREELTLILKNLGCATTTPLQKKTLAKLLESEEFSSELEFPFLVKFLVNYQEACVEEILLKMKSDEEEEGIPVENLVQVLYQMSQYMNKKGAIALLTRVGGDPECKVVDRRTFSKMLEAVRYDKALAWRETCGFSESQLMAIKHAFDSHGDEKDDGVTMNRDGRVLQALQLLNLEPPPDKRDQLMHALLRVDRAGRGTLTFHDFLLLVRHLENHKLYARTLAEKEKAKLAGLDADAIQQFRQCFNDCEPNDSGKVRIGAIQKLFADIGMVRNSKHKKQLQDIINEVTGGDNSGLEFSQFLEVLHSLEQAGNA